MIVTCESCATQFQLDDAKVKGDGIRVRCSRCKHAFFVAAPGREPGPDADEVERRVQAALDGAPPEPPDATRDLPEPASEPPESPEPTGPPEAHDPLRSRDALPPPEEVGFESDWQFNDDSSPGAGFASGPGATGSGDPLLAAREAVDDLLGDVSEPALRLEPDPLDAAPAPEGRDAFGDPFEGGASDPGGGEASLEREGWALPDPAAPASPPPVAATPAAGREGVALPQPPAAAAVAEVESPPRPIAVGVEAGSSRAARWLRRGLDAGGWATATALAGAALYGALVLAPAQSRWNPGAQQAAGVVVESLRGRWIENLHAGPLYVVSGSVRRAPRAGSSENQLPALRLVDRSGDALAGAVAVMAVPLPRSRLRGAEPQRLAAAQRARPLPPLRAGESRRFQAIFEEVPTRAAGLRVEGVARPPRPPPPEAAARGAPAATPVAAEAAPASGEPSAETAAPPAAAAGR